MEGAAGYYSEHAWYKWVHSSAPDLYWLKLKRLGWGAGWPAVMPRNCSAQSRRIMDLILLNGGGQWRGINQWATKKLEPVLYWSRCTLQMIMWLCVLRLIDCVTVSSVDNLMVQGQYFQLFYVGTNVWFLPWKILNSSHILYSWYVKLQKLKLKVRLAFTYFVFDLNFESIIDYDLQSLGKTTQ